MTTSIHSGTTPARTQSISDFSFDRVNPDNVKLRINPFGSASSLDKLIFDGYDFPQSASMPNLEGVKRLNSDTCKKEGSRLYIRYLFVLFLGILYQPTSKLGVNI